MAFCFAVERRNDDDGRGFQKKRNDRFNRVVFVVPRKRNERINREQENNTRFPGECKFPKLSFVISTVCYLSFPGFDRRKYFLVCDYHIYIYANYTKQSFGLFPLATKQIVICGFVYDAWSECDLYRNQKNIPFEPFRRYSNTHFVKFSNF